MKLLLIGDIHDDIQHYISLINRAKSTGFDRSYQLGDLGYKDTYDHWKDFTIKLQNHPHNYVVRGNHDFPCINPRVINTFDCHELNDEHRLFMVRGAFSIDKDYLQLGTTYFQDEELNYNEMTAAMDSYLEQRPTIVLSHDCPNIVRELMFNIPNNASNRTKTSSFLQEMFEEHKPKYWVFGHHHRNAILEIDGTTFICVADRSSLLLNL